MRLGTILIGCYPSGYVLLSVVGWTHFFRFMVIGVNFMNVSRSASNMTGGWVGICVYLVVAQG